MLKVYDIAMRAGRRVILALGGRGTMRRGGTPSKLRMFAAGQRGALDAVRQAGARLDRSRQTVWIHAASLGEFGIARPIARMLKEEAGVNVVLTFFSPTGVNALREHPCEWIDETLYLPFDTRANASAFLDAIRPDCAVFMVSEYWHTYLDLLRQREIPTMLVSAVIRENSAFFRWYGGLYRRSVKCYNEIFVLDSLSARRLHDIGAKCVRVNGDPLFDNVKIVASAPWSHPVISGFARGHKVFVAGSVHDDADLDLVVSLANRHRDTRFIIVPHEIRPATLQHIAERLEGPSRLLSECTEETDLSQVQTLVIDSVGMLASLYRVGTWAYVGGGFTRLLHSVIEPVVYGLPVAFGPVSSRKITPTLLTQLGIGKTVTTPEELDAWFTELKENDTKLGEISGKAHRFVEENLGATRRVVDRIKQELCRRK